MESQMLSQNEGREDHEEGLMIILEFSEGCLRTCAFGPGFHLEFVL